MHTSKQLNKFHQEITVFRLRTTFSVSTMQNCIVPVSQSQSIVTVVCLVLAGLQSVCGFIKQSIIFICGFIESMKLLCLRNKEHLMRNVFNRCRSLQHRRVFNWFNKLSWHRGLYSYCGKISYNMTGNMGTNMSVIMRGTYISIICFFFCSS